MEKTLLIIKPDSVAASAIGKILARVEEEGFRIVNLHMEHLSRERACAFYQEHEGKPFFEGLVEFMTSGPCVPVVLEREDAVARLRAVVGATDPTKAEPGTLRQLHGSANPRNAVHASDSTASSQRERDFFFTAK